jgi:hypothetical protein
VSGQPDGWQMAQSALAEATVGILVKTSLSNRFVFLPNYSPI